jgi:hypothetical protein
MCFAAISEQIRNYYGYFKTLADIQTLFWGHQGTRDHTAGNRRCMKT